MSVVRAALLIATAVCVYDVTRVEARRKHDFDTIIDHYVGHDIGKVREFRGYKGKGEVPRVKIDTIVKKKKKYGYGYRRQKNPKGVEKPALFAVNTNPGLLHDPHADEKEVAATLLFAGDDFKNAKYGIPAPSKKRKNKGYKRPPKYQQPHKYPPQKPQYPPPKYEQQQKYPPPKYEQQQKYAPPKHEQAQYPQQSYKEQQGYGDDTGDQHYVPPNQGYGPVPRSSYTPPSHAYQPPTDTGYSHDSGHGQGGNSQGGYGQSGYGESSGFDYSKGFDLGVQLSYKPGNNQDYGQSQDQGYGGSQDQGYGGSQDQGYGGSQDQGYGGSQDQGYGGSQDQGYGGSHDQGYGQHSYPEPHKGGYPSQPSYEPPKPLSYEPPHSDPYGSAPSYPDSHHSAPQSGYGKPDATALSGLFILMGEAAKPQEQRKGYTPAGYGHQQGYSQKSYGHEQGYGQSSSGYHDDQHEDPYQKKKYKKKIKFSQDEKVVLLY